jgi:DNA repair protein RadA/Sms
MPETDIDSIIVSMQNLKPRVAIIDSIQTVFTSELDSIPGSVSQIRECCHRLMRYAKDNNTAIFIVGHVTKDGNIAGPRVLEHMVDCVLYFEGDRHQAYRILRAVKNRFGSTNEIGVFEMKDGGLIEVENPSLMLLSGRPVDVSGSAVVCSMEGSRTLLAEIQALISPTGFGTPRRMTSGVDYNRSVMLLAVIEKRLGINLQNQDAYINVVGGLKLIETATDLALVLAVISSCKNLSLPHNMAAIGEVGLTGEIRAVGFADKRISEMAKLGFEVCILPYDNLQGLIEVKGIKIYGVKNLSEVMRVLQKDLGLKGY